MSEDRLTPDERIVDALREIVEVLEEIRDCLPPPPQPTVMMYEVPSRPDDG